LRGIVIASAEGELKPLFRDRAEFEVVKGLADDLAQELLLEPNT
jgi:hypothetical protein